MTAGELRALEAYRSHNGIRRRCECDGCAWARRLLARMDSKRGPRPFDRGPEGKAGAVTTKKRGPR